MLKPLTVAVVALSLTVPEVQLPGDRPAANPRATRSVVMARNGIDRHQSAARVGGRPARAPAGRQRHRRRRHRRRGPLGRRTDDERRRRRPVRDRVRREDEDGARPERERPGGRRGDAGGVPAPQARRDPVSRRALGQRARRRRRLERAAREARHDDARARSSRPSATRATASPSARSSPDSGRTTEPILAQRSARRPRRFCPAASAPTTRRRLQEPGSGRDARARSRAAGATRSTAARSPRRSPTT